MSPISAWEIGLLASRNRISLALAPDDWFAALLALHGVRLAPVSPAILIAPSSLPGAPPRDPADRIIAATARAYGHTLITRDGELIPYARTGHLLAINC